MAEDQRAVIDFLAAPSTHGGTAVSRIDTHASIVFLAGARAYKLKRAVRFDYLDFSTLERRRPYCEAEVRLNRLTAPTLYRGAVPVTRGDDGAYELGGKATPVDWVVEMNRFSDDALFDRMAAAGTLDLQLIPALAVAIARFHLSAAHRPDHGGRAGLSWVIEGNAAGFAEFGKGWLDPSAAYRVTDDASRLVEKQATLLEERRASGYVRQCHGDLHLRNIVLLEGRPTLFDAVEFNDEISCIDVLYDLAFLLMDLWRRRLPHHANAVWKRYLAETADFDGIRLMPLFLSCRAAVRAKTSATAAGLQNDAQRRAELQRTAREYLEMAEQLLHPRSPLLMAIGGFSGSGKSTLALSLAPSIGGAPGALVLRSDEIRKHLAGVPALQRLGPEEYAPAMSERVYASLAKRAAQILDGGHSVIIDAVFSRPEHRRAIEAVAAAASVPFIGLWLEAPESLLIARTAQRSNDPSDADASVVQQQWRGGTGEIGWDRLDAALPATTVLSAAMDRVGARPEEDRLATDQATRLK